MGWRQVATTGVLAAAFGWLVPALGCDRFEAVEAKPMLREVAERAANEAEQLAGDPAAADAPSEGAPAGYVVMTAKAQLGVEYGNATLLMDETEQVVVPIFVGTTEGLSIGLRIDGKSYARPLTHDLLDALLKRLGATLVRAQVDELRPNPSGEGGVFIGTVVVRDRAGKLHAVDARPSDAIALAIGNRAPIYVAKPVLDTAGRPIDMKDRETDLPL